MAQNETIDPVEQEFRANISRHSFAAKVWGGLAGASFFGALMSLAQGLVGKASSMYIKDGNAMLGAVTAVLNPLPLAVLGGLGAFGVFATYMAQREETEANILQSENQARQNAKCLTTGKGVEHTPVVEYEQNCRSDNKKWVEAISRAEPQLSHQLH
jgi:hypothetical protein